LLFIKYDEIYQIKDPGTGTGWTCRIHVNGEEQQTILVGELEWKKPLGITRLSRREDNANNSS
jgi:hypothetical protein